jgi:transposase
LYRFEGTHLIRPWLPFILSQAISAFSTSPLVGSRGGVCKRCRRSSCLIFSPRHRHQEFIRFLKKIDSETPTGLNLHLIVDNYGTHKHPRVKSWIRRHPRFHLHFIPTSSSWVNMVERWFREITDKRIRRGVFRSVPELIAAIEDYMNNHNPRVFVWTASVESIMAKIVKCKEALDALH